MTTQIQICVVAHNEEQHIKGCLQSIEQALAKTSNVSASVDIINNGSKDNTQSIAEEFCLERAGWSAHNVTLGDKANAWNLGVYKYATKDLLTIYIDGDCRITPDTFNAFIQAHHTYPNAYIYAGIPATLGRTTAYTIKNTLAGNALSGNLFALSACFISKIRSLDFHLPVGLIGDDSLLAWVSTQDFKLSNTRNSELMKGVKGAQFLYHRLAPTSIANIRLYIRRLQRYSLRHIQQCCIRQFLEQNDNFEKLPKQIEPLYKYLSSEFVRNNSMVNKYFDKKAFTQARVIAIREKEQ